MVEAVVDLQRTVVVPATPDEVFSVIADVWDSVSHFPGVAALTEQDGVYNWTLRPIGAGDASLETAYACRYHRDDSCHGMAWTSEPGLGNARVSGRWELEASAGGTELTLHNRLALDLPIPRVLASVARPIVHREYSRLLERYLDNLAVTFAGGDGRVWEPREES